MRLVHIYILLLVSSASFAQDTTSLVQKPAVVVIARSFGDSIVLRWAVTTPMGWKLSNQNGFIIERHTLLHNGKFDIPLPIFSF